MKPISLGVLVETALHDNNHDFSKLGKDVILDSFKKTTGLEPPPDIIRTAFVKDVKFARGQGITVNDDGWRDCEAKGLGNRYIAKNPEDITNKTTRTNLLMNELVALNVSSLNPYYVVVDAYSGSTFTANIKEAAEQLNKDIFTKARACRYVRGFKADRTPVVGEINEAGWDNRKSETIQLIDKTDVYEWTPLLTSHSTPIQWINAPETQIDSAGKASPSTDAGKALGLFKTKDGEFLNKSDANKLIGFTDVGPSSTYPSLNNIFVKSNAQSDCAKLDDIRRQGIFTQSVCTIEMLHSQNKLKGYKANSQFLSKYNIYLQGETSNITKALLSMHAPTDNMVFYADTHFCKANREFDTGLANPSLMKLFESASDTHEALKDIVETLKGKARSQSIAESLYSKSTRSGKKMTSFHLMCKRFGDACQCLLASTNPSQYALVTHDTACLPVAMAYGVGRIIFTNVGALYQPSGGGKVEEGAYTIFEQKTLLSPEEQVKNAVLSIQQSHDYLKRKLQSNSTSTAGRNGFLSWRDCLAAPSENDEFRRICKSGENLCLNIIRLEEGLADPSRLNRDDIDNKICQINLLWQQLLMLLYLSIPISLKIGIVAGRYNSLVEEDPSVMGTISGGQETKMFSKIRKKEKNPLNAALNYNGKPDNLVKDLPAFQRLSSELSELQNRVMAIDTCYYELVHGLPGSVAQSRPSYAQPGLWNEPTLYTRPDAYVTALQSDSEKRAQVDIKKTWLEIAKTSTNSASWNQVSMTQAKAIGSQFINAVHQVGPTDAPTEMYVPCVLYSWRNRFDKSSPSPSLDTGKLLGHLLLQGRSRASTKLEKNAPPFNDEGAFDRAARLLRKHAAGFNSFLVQSLKSLPVDDVAEVLSSQKRLHGYIFGEMIPAGGHSVVEEFLENIDKFMVVTKNDPELRTSNMYRFGLSLIQLRRGLMRRHILESDEFRQGPSLNNPLFWVTGTRQELFRRNVAMGRRNANRIGPALRNKLANTLEESFLNVMVNKNSFIELALKSFGAEGKAPRGTRPTPDELSAIWDRVRDSQMEVSGGDLADKLRSKIGGGLRDDEATAALHIIDLLIFMEEGGLLDCGYQVDAPKNDLTASLEASCNESALNSLVTFFGIGRITPQTKPLSPQFLQAWFKITRSQSKPSLPLPVPAPRPEGIPRVIETRRDKGQEPSAISRRTKEDQVQKQRQLLTADAPAQKAVEDAQSLALNDSQLPAVLAFKEAVRANWSRLRKELEAYGSGNRTIDYQRWAIRVNEVCGRQPDWLLNRLWTKIIRPGDSVWYDFGEAEVLPRKAEDRFFNLRMNDRKIAKNVYANKMSVPITTVLARMSELFQIEARSVSDLTEVVPEEKQNQQAQLSLQAPKKLPVRGPSARQPPVQPTAFSFFKPPFEGGGDHGDICARRRTLKARPSSMRRPRNRTLSKHRYSKLRGGGWLDFILGKPDDSISSEGTTIPIAANVGLLQSRWRKELSQLTTDVDLAEPIFGPGLSDVPTDPTYKLFRAWKKMRADLDSALMPGSKEGFTTWFPSEYIPVEQDSVNAMMPQLLAGYNGTKIVNYLENLHEALSAIIKDAKVPAQVSTSLNFIRETLFRLFLSASIRVVLWEQSHRRTLVSTLAISVKKFLKQCLVSELVESENRQREKEYISSVLAEQDRQDAKWMYDFLMLKNRETEIMDKVGPAIVDSRPEEVIWAYQSHWHEGNIAERSRVSSLIQSQKDEAERLRREDNEPESVRWKKANPGFTEFSIAKGVEIDPYFIDPKTGKQMMLLRAGLENKLKELWMKLPPVEQEQWAAAERETSRANLEQIAAIRADQLANEREQPASPSLFKNATAWIAKLTNPVPRLERQGSVTPRGYQTDEEDEDFTQDQTYEVESESDDEGEIGRNSKHVQLPTYASFPDPTPSSLKSVPKIFPKTRVKSANMNLARVEAQNEQLEKRLVRDADIEKRIKPLTEDNTLGTVIDTLGSFKTRSEDKLALSNKPNNVAVAEQDVVESQREGRKDSQELKNNPGSQVWPSSVPETIQISEEGKRLAEEVAEEVRKEISYGPRRSKPTQEQMERIIREQKDYASRLQEEGAIVLEDAINAEGQEEVDQQTERDQRDALESDEARKRKKEIVYEEQVALSRQQDMDEEAAATENAALEDAIKEALLEEAIKSAYYKRLEK